jgi:hypothetical protein
MRALVALPFLLAACPDVLVPGDPALQTVPCSPTDAPSSWMIGAASGASPLTVTLSLQTFAITGVELANFFTVDGGNLDNTQFDAGSLASASAVTLTISNPAPTVTIHTGATCSGKAKAIDAVVDMSTLNVTVTAH